MAANKDVVEKLKDYSDSGIFNESYYDVFVMIPNNDDICHTIKSLLDACIEETIAAVQNGANKNQIKGIIKKGLRRFNKMQYDTEEREFICHCFSIISGIVEINFSRELNEWLYGKLLSFLLTFRR